jgi:hypothetical protein
MPFLSKHVQKSFREALEEVYKLDKFPLRQHVMEYALESNGFEMEMQVALVFFSCTYKLMPSSD